MKCPLLTAAEISHEPELKPSSNDCLKEECAWWDSTMRKCSIYSLVDMLTEMVRKMPHAGQFTK